MTRDEARDICRAAAAAWFNNPQLLALEYLIKLAETANEPVIIAYPDDFAGTYQTEE